MSHYFQQLLTSSGLVQPALSVPSLPANAPHSAAEFTEVSEETSVIPPGPSFASPREVTSGLAATPEVRTTGTTRDTQPARTPAHPEPGVVEIISPRNEEHVIRPLPLTPVTAQKSAVTPPVPPTAESSEPQIFPAPSAASVTTKPSAEKSSSNTGSAPTVVVTPTGIPSPDELIQHVFRWVAQNPTDLTPAALSNYSTATSEPAKPAQPKPSVRPSTVTAVRSSEPQSAAPPALAPERPSTRTQPPAPPVATESTVEISIGTLQIQVEAPPAPAPKPSRRPTTPRHNTATHPAAVMSRPAIDLNRLRRGFYV